MERSKPVADRIRPILEAMERSIDSARRKRCNVPQDDPTPPTGGDGPVNRHSQASSDRARPSGGDDSPPRLKARPKRPLNVHPNASNWRSAS